MPTITIPGFIHAKPAYEWEEGPHIIQRMRMDLFQHESLSEGGGWVYVAPGTLTFDMPENWDPRGVQIEMLQAQRASVLAECQQKITAIDRTISELQAIEYAPF